MRNKRKQIVGLLLSASLLCSAMAIPLEANAASTETVYVVDKSTCKGSVTGVTNFQYDNNGMIVQWVSNVEPAMTFTYENGLLTKVSDPYTDIAVIHYDAKNRMKSKKTYNSSIQYAYNGKGQVSKSVSKNNYGIKRTTKYSYDENGNPVKTTTSNDSAQIVTTYTYDGKGNFTGSKCETDSYNLSYTSKNTYDSKGRLVKRVVKDSYKQKQSQSGVASGRSATNYTETVTYRQVKVPKNKADAVKKQQFALLNDEAPVTIIPWYY